MTKLLKIQIKTEFEQCKLSAYVENVYRVRQIKIFFIGVSYFPTIHIVHQELAKQVQFPPIKRLTRC
jgi:hypothetical protein